MACWQPRRLHLEFIKNRDSFHNSSFFETIKKSGIIYKEEKKKTPKAILVLNED